MNNNAAQQVARAAGAILLAASFAASAGTAVVVNKDAGITSMTADEVAQVFLGKAGKLPNGKTALPLDLPEGSAVRDGFYNAATGKNPSQVKAYWAKLVFTGKGEPPRVVDDDEEMLDLVSDNPSTIGYVDSESVTDDVTVVLTLP